MFKKIVSDDPESSLDDSEQGYAQGGVVVWVYFLSAVLFGLILSAV